mmetsp:Transcript_1711/g.3248  ORF Transcript_1711/g.3248 Transcript_1711/m.3248 type:complete len:219 (-) Transcript_1711:25-681(-)
MCGSARSPPRAPTGSRWKGRRGKGTGQMSQKSRGYGGRGIWGRVQSTKMHRQSRSRRSPRTQPSGRGGARSHSRQRPTQVQPSRTRGKCTNRQPPFKGRRTRRPTRTPKQPPRLPTGEGRPGSNRKQEQSSKSTTTQKEIEKETSTSGESTTNQSPRGGSNSSKSRRASMDSTTTRQRTGGTTRAWFQSLRNLLSMRRTTQRCSGRAWKQSSCRAQGK